MSVRHALVITGGPPPVGTAALPPTEFVVAADWGAEHAALFGLVSDLVVGDLDSVSAETLTSMEMAGVRIERHPTGKDQTDLELALTAAMDLGATAVTIVATASGRPDHAMANLLTAAAERWAGLDVDLLVDSSRAWVVRRRLGPGGSGRLSCQPHGGWRVGDRSYDHRLALATVGRLARTRGWSGFEQRGHRGTRNGRGCRRNPPGHLPLTGRHLSRPFALPYCRGVVDRVAGDGICSLVVTLGVVALRVQPLLKPQVGSAG